MRRQITAMVAAFAATLWIRALPAAPPAINWDQVADEATAKPQTYIRIESGETLKRELERVIDDHK
jgi:hypothetical protein